MKKIRIILLAACLACMALFMTFSVVGATPPKAPERIKAVMIGDRLVDVSLKLGVIPEGISVRLSMWPDKIKVLPVATQVLGCPNCVTTKRPKCVPTFMKEQGITRIIIEKNDKFCLYMPKVNPMNVVPLVQDVPGVTVEYVDFNQGMASAIAQTAKLLGKESRGKEVAAAYEKAMKKVEADLPKTGLGKRVLVLNGTYSQASGKSFIRFEAPGGYTDQYILKPLGCTNVAAAMMSDTMRVSKGHVSAGRLTGLAAANPDVIVITGNGFSVQKALHDAKKKNPALADVPAIRDGEVYCLPFYGDSSVLEYPGIFRQWQSALTD